MRWTPTDIRLRRTAKGWYQDDLATALGVSRRAVTNWETGQARPSADHMDALDQALGDAAIPEPTLRGATDMELLAEMAHRMGLGRDQLPDRDLRLPRRDNTHTAHHPRTRTNGA